MSSARARYRANAVGVGWSKTAVVGNFRPVADLSRFRNSTAPSESKPSSLNSWSVPTASAESCPSTAAALERTMSSSSCSCSDVLIAASRCRRSEEDSTAAADSAVRRAARIRPRNIGGRPPTAEWDRIAARFELCRHRRTSVPARAPHRTARGRPPTTSG